MYFGLGLALPWPREDGLKSGFINFMSHFLSDGLGLVKISGIKSFIIIFCAISYILNNQKSL